jgi:hypothetical protein
VAVFLGFASPSAARLAWRAALLAETILCEGCVGRGRRQENCV